MGSSPTVPTALSLILDASTTAPKIDDKLKTQILISSYFLLTVDNAGCIAISMLNTTIVPTIDKKSDDTGD